MFEIDGMSFPILTLAYYGPGILFIYKKGLLIYDVLMFTRILNKKVTKLENKVEIWEYIEWK